MLSEQLISFMSYQLSFISLMSYSPRDAYRNFFQRGGKLGPHKQMTLVIMIFAYIYTSICLLRFALFVFEEILEVLNKIIIGFNSK